MRFLEGKNIFKKLLISIALVIMLMFVFSNKSEAKGEWGGVILDPVMSFFVTLGDGTISLVQNAILGTEGTSIIEINTSKELWQKIITAVVVVTVIGIGITALVLSGGATAIVEAPLINAIAGTLSVVIKIGEAAAVTGITTFLVTGYIQNAVLPDDFQLPTIALSPYEIFAGQVAALDVNFINPKDEIIKNSDDVPITTATTTYSDSSPRVSSFEQAKQTLIQSIVESDTDFDISAIPNTGTYNFEYKGKKYKITVDEQKIPDSDSSGVDTRTYKFTLYEVGAGEGIQKSTAAQLAPTVAGWYKNLRNIAVIASLSILVYIGIRIVLSSTARDQSKYKQMLSDWVIALCLIFIMHYIMAGANLFVEEITKVFDGVKVTNSHSADINLDDISTNRENIDDDSNNVATQFYEQNGIQLFEIKEPEQVKKAYKTLVEENDNESTKLWYQGLFSPSGSSSPTVLYWPARNFTEQARMMLQYEDAGDDSINSQVYVSLGWKLIYCMLIIYTIIFLFTYVKRVIYMAFLTIIAPLVAMTYPLDKIKDGSAQAFNYWFKEYIYNLLLQIIHLLLYTILIGSAMQFAANNIIYVIVALGFMVPAEKLVRSMFGFKGETPGFFSGAAGAGIMMGLTQRLLGRKPPERVKDDEEEPKDFIRTKEDLDKGIKFNEDDELQKNYNNRANIDIPESDFGSDNSQDNMNGDDAIKTAQQEAQENAQQEAQENAQQEAQENAQKVAREASQRVAQQMAQNESSTDDEPSTEQSGGATSNNRGETSQNRRIPSQNSGSDEEKNKIKKILETNSNKDPKQYKQKTGLISGFSRMGGSYLRRKGKRMLKQVQKDHTARKFVSSLGGVGLGVVGATAGAMAAIAGGKADVKNVGIGALAGYKFGSGGTSSVIENINISKDIEEFERGRIGDEAYNRKQTEKYIEKLVREHLNDENYRNELAVRLGDSGLAEEALKEIMPEATKYGYDSAQDVATLFLRSRGATGERDENGNWIINEDTVEKTNGEADYDKTLKKAMFELKTVKAYDTDLSKLTHDQENALISDRRDALLKKVHGTKEYEKVTSDAKNMALSREEMRKADEEKRRIENSIEPTLQKDIGNLKHVSALYYNIKTKK